MFSVSVFLFLLLRITFSIFSSYASSDISSPSMLYPDSSSRPLVDLSVQLTSCPWLLGDGGFQYYGFEDCWIGDDQKSRSLFL